MPILSLLFSFLLNTLSNTFLAIVIGFAQYLHLWKKYLACVRIIYDLVDIVKKFCIFVDILIGNYALTICHYYASTNPLYICALK